MRVLRWNLRRRKLATLTLMMDAFLIEPMQSIDDAIKILRDQIDHSCAPL
jgi:hypothetical protein